MDGDAGVKTRDNSEESSLLQTHGVHGFLTKSCTETRFVGRGSWRTEAVLFINSSPNSSTGFPTVSSVPDPNIIKHLNQEINLSRLL